MEDYTQIHPSLLRKKRVTFNQDCPSRALSTHLGHSLVRVTAPLSTRYTLVEVNHYLILLIRYLSQLLNQLVRYLRIAFTMLLHVFGRVGIN